MYLSLILLACLAKECDAELETAWVRKYTAENLGPTGDISKEVENDGKCWVTNREPMRIADTMGQIPQFCNFESDGTRAEKCCFEGHDSKISEWSKELWPQDCQNDDYPGLNKLICLGCHPDQPKYVDTK